MLPHHEPGPVEPVVVGRAKPEDMAHPERQNSAAEVLQGRGKTSQGFWQPWLLKFMASGRSCGCVLLPHDTIRLRTFLTGHNVELDWVAFLERLVTVNLNGGIVNEDIGTIFTTDEAEALCIVEPFDCSLVLMSHRLSSFLCSTIAT